MTELTPRVYHDITCFCCLNNAKTSTYFKLNGRKCINEDISEKLAWFFDGCLPEDLNESGKICRSCFVKITNAWDLKISLISGYEQFSAADGYRSKRLAVSPLSPSLVSDAPSASHSVAASNVKRVRRRLDLPDHCYVSNSGDNSASDVKTNVTDPPACSMHETVQLQYNIALSVTRGEFDHASKCILDHPEFKACVQQNILNEIEQECKALSSRSIPFSSVLWRFHNIEKLMKCEDFIDQIYSEMKNRVPFVADIFSRMSGSDPLAVDQDHIAALTSAYAIIMKRRNPTLSAWHKMTSCIALEGNLDDSALTKFNRLGLMMSPSSKLKMQEDLARHCHEDIVDQLKKNPLVKITGDNLDIFIRTSHQASDQHHRDLHLFASNLIFCKFTKPDMDDTPTYVKPKADDMFLTDDEQEQLAYANGVIIGRILMDIPELSWMKLVLPQHIRHGNHGAASKKTDVYQLPIMMKNEAKHEDCLDIMDQYVAELKDVFTSAHGDTSALETLKVAVGGDQLTRVRLQEAKELRGLAPDPAARLDYLDPIVCEWWHNKQDFLEKAYKSLYLPQTCRQEGTLFQLKTVLQITSVNGRVKQNFQSHHDLLVLLTKQLIKEQALEFFGMESFCSKLTKNQPGNLHYATKNKKNESARTLLFNFMSHYDYLHQPSENVHREEEEDEVYNYFMQVCYWGLQLMALDDTAKEGDGERSILNAKYNIPFFFSHSHLSKYLVENVLYVRQSICLSPLQRSRVLDCAFVNTSGGEGNNVEADLVQEHSVRHQKTLIKQLGANKTVKAISRATAAAHGVFAVSNNIVPSSCINHKSNRHCKRVSDADADIIERTLRRVRPFKFTPGRKCDGLKNFKRSPFHKFSKTKLSDRLTQILQRLAWGQTVHVHEEVEGESQNDDEDLLFGYVPI